MDGSFLMLFLDNGAYSFIKFVYYSNFIIFSEQNCEFFLSTTASIEHRLSNKILVWSAIEVLVSTQPAGGVTSHLDNELHPVGDVLGQVGAGGLG